MFWEIQASLKQASVPSAPLQSTWIAPPSSCFLGSHCEPYVRCPHFRHSWPKTKNGTSLLELWVPLLKSSEGTIQTLSPLCTQTWGAFEEAAFLDQFSSLRNCRLDFAGVLAPTCQPALSCWQPCLLMIPVFLFVPSLCWQWWYSRNFPGLVYWSPFPVPADSSLARL